MKKTNTIFLYIGLLSLIGGCFSSAYALYTGTGALPTNKAITIGIEIPKTYYIKTFSGGSETNSWQMTDVTSAMSPETNKIAEYKLENKSLAKGQVLKGWSSDNAWYQSYSHCWSNSVQTDGDVNYVVPMTSNSYTFYLKLYSDNTSQLFITANKDVMFFKPNSAWADASATFSLWEQNDNANEIWKDFVTDSDGYYKVDIVRANFHVVRFGPGQQSHDWSQKWGESGQFTVANLDTNNAFVLHSDRVDSNFNGWTAEHCDWYSR